MKCAVWRGIEKGYIARALAYYHDTTNQLKSLYYNMTPTEFRRYFGESSSTTKKVNTSYAQTIILSFCKSTPCRCRYKWIHRMMISGLGLINNIESVV